MPTKLSIYLPLLTIAGIVTLVDQLTKIWVRQNLGLGMIYRADLWISQYVRLLHLKNYGMAGGLFPGLSGVFTVLPFLIGAGILYYYPRLGRDDKLVRFAMALMLGGAAGNLIDRLTQGYVTDFISVGSFPVLNLADAAISVGGALLVLAMLRREMAKPPAHIEQPAPEDDRPR